MELIDKDVYEQHGGAVEINYKGFIVVAPTEHLEQAVVLLKEDECKEDVLKSVNKYLDDNIKAVADGSASQDIAMNLCQDITLWYANEIIEGRAENTGLIN